MKELKTGGFAVSRAGHDLGKYYVIFQMDSEYVYLVDGRIRTISRPKKKKMKHVDSLELLDPVLAAKVCDRTVKNEEIKRAIKLMPNVNSSKEVE
jgi:ribosomal protein L14E/L6E/L27E